MSDALITQDLVSINVSDIIPTLVTLIRVIVVPAAVTLFYATIRAGRGKRCNSGLPALAPVTIFDIQAAIAYGVDPRWKSFFSPKLGDLILVHYILLAVGSIAIYACLLQFEDQISHYNVDRRRRFPWGAWLVSWAAPLAMATASIAMFVVR